MYFVIGKAHLNYFIFGPAQKFRVEKNLKIECFAQRMMRERQPIPPTALNV